MMILKQWVKTFVSYVIVALSYVIPKRKNLYLFFPVHNREEFSGNLKSVFLYISTMNPTYRLYWKTDSPETLKLLRAANYNVVSNGLKFLYLIFIAEKIFIDTGLGWLAGQFDIVQVWHGTGFKNIGLLNPQRNKAELASFKKHFNCYSLVVANSESDAQQKRISFGTDKVYITGSPRNDIFFSDLKENKKLKEKYKLEQYNKIYLYAPTFRDVGTSVPFEDNFWIELNNYATINKYVFIIKKHPLDTKLKVPKDFSNIIDLSNGDVQDLLMISDVLISDYSSIVTDFVVMDKPVIYYIYDYNEYTTKSRDMYHKYEEVIPGPFAHNTSELMQLMTDLSWFEEMDYLILYKNFQSKFNQYLDGRSSERVYNLIRSTQQ